MKPKMQKQKFEELIKKIRKYNSRADINLVRRGYEFAQKHHSEQYRKSGEDYILHPLGVAEILADLELDISTIVAGLLHDVIEDTEVSDAQIKEEFGDEIYELTDGVTKLGRLIFKTQEEHQAENLRKMMLAIAKDIRVILIKLADRLHNMRTLNYLNREKQIQKAGETLDIYAPIAHRLGMSEMKSELEDLAFNTLEPKKYAEIQKMVVARLEEREKYLDGLAEALTKELRRVGIKPEISGRAKHFYSIYQKMIQREKEFNEIYDLTALRILVDNLKDCYGALGIVHSLWKPIPGRFKDYIAMPKFNMYQSLHTTVIDPLGKPLEVQIRTHEMHQTSEYGIAAHWKYKEKVKKEDKFSNKLLWFKQMLEWQSELKDPNEFMKTLKIDLFQDEVFVFTPNGKVLSLPVGSTPLDFAYTVHTDVGHRCVGAKINNRIVPLEYKLKNGDMVEILTSKTTGGPSRDWLKIVKTSRAKNKIRQWFSKENREDSEHLGKELLHRAMRKHGLEIRETISSKYMQSVVEKLNFTKQEKLFESIGSGKTSPQQVITKLINAINKDKDEKVSIVEEEEKFETVRPSKPPSSNIGVKVKGIDNVLIRIARCCNPVPPDDIIGFITRGRGVSIHRRDCLNAKELISATDRIIDVAWDTKQAANFIVEIQVEALDRAKLLRDISTVLGDSGLNILSASVGTGRNQVAICRFVFEIGNIDHLENVLLNIKKIDAVFDAYRLLPGKTGDREGK